MIHYEVVIVGAGPGGYIAAEEAARLGKSVAVIEKNFVGGTCLNVGCIPSKAYLEHAHWIHTINKAQKYGMEIDLKAIDFSKLYNRKNKVVTTLQKGIMTTFNSLNITYIEGEASYQSDNILTVNGKEISFDDLILATGGYPFVPKIAGLDQVNYWTTDTFFNMEKLPEQLVIIGGGVIAVELAFAMEALGAKVTLLEVAPDILLTEDPDARKVVKQKLQRTIDIHTQVSIKEVSNGSVILEDGTSFNFDELLVATGRKATITIAQEMGLDLDDNQRFIKVNEHYQTSNKHVYAIGDIIGGYTLAHAASAEGMKAARAIAQQAEPPVKMKAIPRSLFVDPEVASFGITADEASDLGYNVYVKQLPFSFNGRAIAQDTTDGFIKLIVEKQFGEILGCVICGPNATEILHQVLTLVASEGTVYELASTVFSHPTVSELVQDTAKAVISDFK